MFSRRRSTNSVTTTTSSDCSFLSHRPAKCSYSRWLQTVWVVTWPDEGFSASWQWTGSKPNIYFRLWGKYGVVQWNGVPVHGWNRQASTTSLPPGLRGTTWTQRPRISGSVRVAAKHPLSDLSPTVPDDDTSYQQPCWSGTQMTAVCAADGPQMTISLERVVWSTSCFILGEGFWGRQIEWTYLRLYQIQDSAARHLGKFRLTISLEWVIRSTFMNYRAALEEYRRK